MKKITKTEVINDIIYCALGAKECHNNENYGDEKSWLTKLYGACNEYLDNNYDEETIEIYEGMWTGLKDIHGKKIYGGNTVRFMDEHETCGKVFWSKRNAMWAIMSGTPLSISVEQLEIVEEK